MAQGTLELRGKTATVPEYNVGMALEEAGVDFLFQVSYWGGRTIRGGQVLDFLIFNPFEQPLQVFSDYYHGAQFASADRLKLQILEKHFNKEVLIVWSGEAETMEQARATLRKLKVIR